MNTPWLELAVVFGLCAIGNILFGHFVEGTPKWRRVMKTLLIGAMTVIISTTAGRTWFFVLLGLETAFGVVVHAWWLPRKGINGWTGEPKARYYQLRGWTLK